MIKYISTKGKIAPLDFDEAVLQGFAQDGGLFVPQVIPKIPKEKLNALSDLPYTELAFEMLSYFIDPKIIPTSDLKELIKISFSSFDHPDLMPLVSLKEDSRLIIMELFHGPTLSFKDIAMGFLVNTMDYLLTRKGKHLNIVLATTGDTGPAAAHATAGKKSMDCWPLYPAGMITPEQERQMTTLCKDNIHPVAVENCKNGGDDLDIVVANLFAHKEVTKDLNLSSVNSINLCRVMVQAVHYAYGYFKACKKIGAPVGEAIDISVPSGAFGNLFAGFIAKQMGIPIRRFICANNENKTLHRAISTGVFAKKDLIQTVSSAIDIVIPYNFWRFLYFSCDGDSSQLTRWMNTFDQDGKIILDKKTLKRIQAGYSSCSLSDEATLSTIKNTWEKEQYLLDPHGAVAVAGAKELAKMSTDPVSTLCFATAHPAKFPDIIKKALNTESDLPDQGYHGSLTLAKKLSQNYMTCDIDELEHLLIHAMGTKQTNE